MYDMKNLGKLKRLDENNAEAMKAFWAFDKATFVPGAIDVSPQAADGRGRRPNDPVPLLHRIAREGCPRGRCDRQDAC